MGDETMESNAGSPQKDVGRENKLKNCQEAIQQVWSFLEKYISFCNTHGAEFISHNHWETYVPCETQRQLLQMSQEELVELPLIYHNSQGNCATESKEMSYTSNKWLYSYITQAYMCHLENLNVLSTLSEAVSDISCDSSRAEAMSVKKGHEVNIMSQVVSAVFASTKADMVVDVGSGKGYLGLDLSRKHNIPVLGLDSSDINTHGAKKREELLGKRFTRTKRQTETINMEEDVSGSKKFEQSCMETWSRDEKKHQSVESYNSIDGRCYVPVTVFVHPGMGLRTIIQQLTPKLCQKQDNVGSLHLVLTGLHTCGSLAVTLMKLFLQDPGAVGLVSVGCCYQQMEEVDYSAEDTCKRSNSHFPLSKFGQKLKLNLGRNARNLASQSLRRIQASKQLQGKDFYWRALLDVVISQLGLPVPDRIKGVRGLNKKCHSFKDYALAALRNLGVSADVVPDDMLHTTEKLHQDAEMKLAALFQVKLVLAPVIETLILLDRLMFLLEQDNVESTHLVQLFDPMTSPRCYAVIAMNNSRK